jgi:hypothetical protein
MKFSDITAAVREAWQFAWPPLVACLVAYYVADFLYPSGVTRVTGTLRSSATSVGSSLSVFKEIIEPFGLTTLVPFVGLVFVITFLFLVNTAAMVWSSELPPYLSYRPDRLLFDRMGEKEKVLLFRRYPTAQHFNAAYYMALEEHKAKGLPLRNSRATTYYQFHNFIKFAVAIALVTFVIAVRNREVTFGLFAKMLVVGAGATVLWGVGFVGLLYEQEQQFSREWAAVRAELQADASKLLEKEITAEERLKIREPIVGRWWRLYAFDPYRVTWFKNTFLDPPRGSERPE